MPLRLMVLNGMATLMPKSIAGQGESRGLKRVRLKGGGGRVEARVQEGRGNADVALEAARASVTRP